MSLANGVPVVISTLSGGSESEVEGLLVLTEGGQLIVQHDENETAVPFCLPIVNLIQLKVEGDCTLSLIFKEKTQAVRVTTFGKKAKTLIQEQLQRHIDKQRYSPPNTNGTIDGKELPALASKVARGSIDLVSQPLNGVVGAEMPQSSSPVIVKRQLVIDTSPPKATVNSRSRTASVVDEPILVKDDRSAIQRLSLEEVSLRENSGVATEAWESDDEGDAWAGARVAWEQGDWQEEAVLSNAAETERVLDCPSPRTMSESIRRRCVVIEGLLQVQPATSPKAAHHIPQEKLAKALSKLGRASPFSDGGINLVVPSTDHAALVVALEQLQSGLELSRLAAANEGESEVRSGLAPLEACLRRLHTEILKLAQVSVSDSGFALHVPRFAAVLRGFAGAWGALAAPQGVFFGTNQAKRQPLSLMEVEAAMTLAKEAARVSRLAATYCNATSLLVTLSHDGVMRGARTLGGIQALLSGVQLPPSALTEQSTQQINVETAVNDSDALAEQLQARFDFYSGTPRRSLDKMAHDPLDLKRVHNLLVPLLARRENECVTQEQIASHMSRAAAALLTPPSPIYSLPRGAPVISQATNLRRPALTDFIAARLLSRPLDAPWSPPLVLAGPRGVGKTHLATEVISREDVKAHFAGGVVWLSVGNLLSSEKATAATESPQHHRGAAQSLPRSLLLEHLCCQLLPIGTALPWAARIPSEREAEDWLLGRLASSAATCLAHLLVLDDVEERSFLSSLRGLGFHILVIASATGDLVSASSSPGLEIVCVDRLSVASSIELVARCAGVAAGGLTLDIAGAATRGCRGLPMALSLMGALLCGKGDDSEAWITMGSVLEETANAAAVDTSLSQTNNKEVAVDAAILKRLMSMCIAPLPEPWQRHYLSLAVLPLRVPASGHMMRALWGARDAALFAAITESLSFAGLMHPVAGAAHGSDGAEPLYKAHAWQSEYVRTALRGADDFLEGVGARQTLFLGRLKVLRAAHAAPPWGVAIHSAMIDAETQSPFCRLGLIACWKEVESLFGFSAFEAYSDSMDALRNLPAHHNQHAVAALLVADFIFSYSSCCPSISSVSGSAPQSPGGVSIGSPSSAGGNGNPHNPTAAVEAALALYRESSRLLAPRPSTLGRQSFTGDSRPSTPKTSSPTASTPSPSPVAPASPPVSPRRKQVLLTYQAAALWGMGRCLRLLGKPEEGVRRYRKGVSVLQSAAGRIHVLSLPCAIELAELAGSLGAETEYRAWDDALVLAEGSCRMESCLCWQRMAACCPQVEGEDSGTGDELTQRAGLLVKEWEAKELCLGDRHPKVASSMSAVALDFCAQASDISIRKGTRIALDAVDLCESTVGEWSLETASALEALSIACQRGGRHDDAIRSSQRCLAIRKVCLGTENREVARTIKLLAGSHASRSGGSVDVEAVQTLLTDALAIQRVCLGRDSEIADTLHALGVHLLLHPPKSKDASLSLLLLEESLSIRVELLGVSHPLSLSTLEVLYAARKKFVRSP